MREQCPRRRPHRTRRCGERQAVRCRGSGLFGVGLSTPAGRLRREVSVSAVYLGLERLVLTGEQVGFPVGQRVEFDTQSVSSSRKYPISERPRGIRLMPAVKLKQDVFYRFN